MEKVSKKIGDKTVEITIFQEVIDVFDSANNFFCTLPLRYRFELPGILEDFLAKYNPAKRNVGEALGIYGGSGNYIRKDRAKYVIEFIKEFNDNYLDKILLNPGEIINKLSSLSIDELESISKAIEKRKEKTIC